jgi:hypothetical protein
MGDCINDRYNAGRRLLLNIQRGVDQGRIISLTIRRHTNSFLTADTTAFHARAGLGISEWHFGEKQMLKLRNEASRPWALLPLRLIIGFGFMAHGLAKWSRGPANFGRLLELRSLPVDVASRCLCGDQPPIAQRSYRVGRISSGGQCDALVPFCCAFNLPAWRLHRQLAKQRLFLQPLADSHTLETKR